MKDLDFRWDSALYMLGRELSEIKLEDGCISNWDLVMPALSKGGMIDAFQLTSIVNVLYRKFGNSEINIILFKSIKDVNETYLIMNDFFKGKTPISFFAAPKYFKDKENIHILKYQDFNIKVYCPVKYSEVEIFRKNWFNKLKDVRKKRPNNRSK